jgi:hypothetical protein
MRSGAAAFPLLSLSSISAILLAISPANAQEAKPPAPAAPILRVQLDSPAKVKLGAAVRAHTTEPVYQDNRLALPAGTRLTGKVIAVTPVPRSQRISAISHGDFTPLRDAEVQFDSLKLANGRKVPIRTTPAAQGSEIVHFYAPGTVHRSIFRRAWAALIGRKNAAVHSITDPGKMNRLEQYVFSQLPWHPQSIDAGSQYDVTLLQMPKPVLDAARQSPEMKSAAAQKSQHELKATTLLHARLQKKLTSKTAKEEDAVVALVTQPFYDTHGQLEVPQGSLLRGRVLRARPAKKWGRNGALRFTFNEVDFPQGFRQQVSGVPAGVDGSRKGSLKLDAEGGVEPKTTPRIMAPLVLGLLATSALTDEDASISHNAAASNGFGLITRIVAVSSGSRVVGGVIGMTDAGRSLYSRFIARGRDVTFPRNSEVEIEVGPIHTTAGPGGAP